MTLTDAQIEELFRFCEKKYVRYYDLQVELVDHLAERIEEEMAANHKLGFEAALQKVYAGFGLFGFAHVVQQKSEALQKQRNREWWLAAKKFFTVPKILLTLALFSFCIAIAQWMPAEARDWVADVIWIAAYIHLLVQLRRVRKPLLKKLILTEYEAIPFFFTPFVIFPDFWTNDNPLSILGFALLCVTAVVMHSASLEVTTKVYREARRLYPKAFAAV